FVLLGSSKECGVSLRGGPANSFARRFVSPGVTKRRAKLFAGPSRRRHATLFAAKSKRKRRGSRRGPQRPPECRRSTGAGEEEKSHSGQQRGREPRENQGVEVEHQGPALDQ